jgi:arginyl-tRNA synthetase
MDTVPIALGIDSKRLELIIYQLVTLKRGDEIVRASKRTGDLVTLRELLDEVGADACRFFFLTRSPQSQMEFDIELATQQSDENPVYYIQYAHARISGILKTARERNMNYNNSDVSLLVHPSELALIRKMLELPELIDTMSQRLEPHHLPHFSIGLATAFHTFYERCRVVSNNTEEQELSKARLKLVDATRIVLSRCLSLMLMSTPDKM